MRQAWCRKTWTINNTLMIDVTDSERMANCLENIATNVVLKLQLQMNYTIDYRYMATRCKRVFSELPKCPNPHSQEPGYKANWTCEQTGRVPKLLWLPRLDSVRYRIVCLLCSPTVAVVLIQVSGCKKSPLSADLSSEKFAMHHNSVQGEQITPYWYCAWCPRCHKIGPKANLA